MEIIIKDSLLSHLTSESLISPFQHGFLPGRSTLSALLSTTFDWLIFFRTGSHTHCVFFDLSKTFDSISHRKLLWKLSSYSIHPQCIEWIKDFLSNRTQTVKIQSVQSHPVKCTSGTPQGLVRSTILFLIYMNDLSSVIKHIRRFAYMRMI